MTQFNIICHNTVQYHQQTTAIDAFSIGCIFFELLCLEHGLFKYKELFRVNGGK